MMESTTDTKGNERYIPVLKRLLRGSRRTIVDISGQTVQSHPFQSFHSTFNRFILIEPHDLLGCLVVLIGGLLIIDPLGISVGLFETMLWLLPALITFDCMAETRVESTDAICIARREFQTAKWIDFWICSTGLQVAGCIFSHFRQHDTRTATEIAQWSISSAMLAAQVVLLSWWIIESGVKSKTGDCIRSKSVKDGFKSTREDVASNQSEEQESSPQRQLVAGRTLSLPELVDTTRETNGRDKSSSSSKLRTPSTATHSNERQHSTTIKSREIDGLVKRVQRNRDIDDASSEYSSSSASSYSRNGSLSDDEESIYSDDSSASKEMSISADMAADGIQSQISSSSQVEVVVSNTVDEQKASFSPKTPAYVAVKNAIGPPEINTLRIPINIVASDHGGFAGSEVANIPAAPPPKTTHPEPPQRASKIIAQLDSLLFDELERLAILSPADTEVVNSAIRSQPANSPLTPRVAALERKRGMKHGEEKQYLKTGTNEIPHDEVPVSPYIKNTASLQLDDLLATRMSDLFPSLHKVERTPEAA